MNSNLFQVCKLSIGSYGYNMHDIKFKTLMENEKIEGKILLDYDVEIKQLADLDTFYWWEGTGNNYSISGFEIHLHRIRSPYIIQYYVTSGLFVVVSWVSILLRDYI